MQEARQINGQNFETPTGLRNCIDSVQRGGHYIAVAIDSKYILGRGASWASSMPKEDVKKVLAEIIKEL